MGWRRKLKFAIDLRPSHTNTLTSNRHGTQAVAARPLTNLAVVERLGMEAGSTLPHLDSQRPLLVLMVISQRLARTRAADSLRRPRHTRPRHLVATTVPGTIKCEI